MATNFPASLDTLTNPTSSDSLSSPSHSAQHANANDAIEALQAKVGADSSAVTSSLDYKVAQLEAAATGKILQVVRVEKTTNFDTTSTSFVDVTGMSVTITPSSTSSAILIWATFTSVHFGSIDNLRGNYAITDASNTVVGGQGLVVIGSTNLTGTSSREFWSSSNIVTYDTPATTSATTYKLRQRTENAATQVRVAGTTSVAQMYALEISA